MSTMAFGTRLQVEGPVAAEIDSRAEAGMVRGRDPLRADALLQALPELNARADRQGLAALLRNTAPACEAVRACTRVERLAMMRDLGIVLGSIKRHGDEPLSIVPELGPVLVELGTRTGMVARDTVYHYTDWNPPGARQRMYVGDAQESALIDAVRRSIDGLRDAIDVTLRLKAVDPAQPGFASAAWQLAGRLKVITSAIDDVRRRVAPEWFARVLRPYFEPIEVDGTMLLGPAAANVPVMLIDVAVWASEDPGETYAEFCRQAAPYLPQQWRGLYERWCEQPSLVGRLRLAATQASSRQFDDAAAAFSDVLRTLIVFRGRHMALARRAYRESVRLYPVGSAGGDLALLEDILNRTRASVAA